MRTPMRSRTRSRQNTRERVVGWGLNALKEQYEKDKTTMQDEERKTGSVTWKVYKNYFATVNGYILVPALLLSLLLIQGAQVMSGYWLVFWQEQQFHKPCGFYVRAPSFFSFIPS